MFLITFGELFAGAPVALAEPKEWVMATRLWSDPRRIYHVSSALELDAWHFIRMDGRLGGPEGIIYDVRTHITAQHHAEGAFFARPVEDSSDPFYIGNVPVAGYLDMDPAFYGPIVGGVLQLD